MSARFANAATSHPVAFETALLLLLRAGFFTAARGYLRHSLFADLRQVIRDEGLPNAPSSPSARYGSGYDTPDETPTTPLDERGNSSFRDQLYRSTNVLSSSSSSSSLPPPVTSTISSGRRNSTSGPSSPSGRARSASGSRKKHASAHSQGIAPVLSGTVFCLTVSECSTLFALILFGGAVNDSSRLLNWNLSLGLVLALITLIIPFGLCLLASLRGKATSTSHRRTLIFTLLPFTLYLFFLWKFGDGLSTLLGVESSTQSISLFTKTLDRICVPGVVLIAALTGGGAVVSAWDAYEWRERFKADAVTQGHINAAERSMTQTRQDLAARHAELEAVSSTQDGQNPGFFGRMFGNNPQAARIKSLQAEIAGLEAMDAQMTRDLQLMKKRKEITEMSKTWSGVMIQALGWIFSVYCVYRVAVSCINLLFVHRTISNDPSARPSDPADVLSTLLAKLAKSMGWEIDVHTWSKAIGFILIGTILLVNLRAGLTYVSRIFRATSAGVSASFMLLFLSQLMAVYLLTSLISIPHSVTTDDNATAASLLLDTLPDFRIFSRLFDAVLLMAAIAVFATRWIYRKVKVDEHLGLQDFV